MEPVKDYLLRLPLSVLLDDDNVDKWTKVEVRLEVKFPVTDVTRVGHAAWRKVFYGR